MTWLGVPVLDWLILAFALGLGVEAWLTTRPTPGEREASPRDIAAAPTRTPSPTAASVDRVPTQREEHDHARN